MIKDGFDQMNIKKIISAIIASAVVAVVPVAAFAEGYTNATFCFDNESGISMWETYGSVAETGLELKVDTVVRETGNAALCIYEDVKAEIDPASQHGGIYISADKLGLENFSGCTIQASVYFEPEAVGKTNAFSLYSDGVLWITSELSAENSGWNKVSLTVPGNAANTNIGFVIPNYSIYTGNVCYVDNVIIYDANGTAIANMGDYAEAAESIEVSVGTLGRILLVVLLVVLIVGIIAGIGFIVSMLLKKFT